MNVLLAVNNEPLENYISKLEDVNVYKSIRIRKTLLNEGEFKDIDVTILSNALPGQENLVDIIDKISSSKDFKGRIIFLYGEDDDKRKAFINYLITRGIYDYHIGNLNPEIINNLLFNPKNRNDVKADILKQEQMQEIKLLVDSKAIVTAEGNIVKTDIKFVEVEKIVKKTVEKTVVKTVKQEILTFFTTDNNLEKDDVLAQIAILLAKKSKQKILVIDMNVVTATMDHFLGIDKFVQMKDIYNSDYDTGMKIVYSSIDKKIFAPELLEDIAVKHKKFKNLDIITGLYDINLFDTLESNHYEQLIDAAKEIYDTIIINTNPAIFTKATYVALSKATKILVTSNANYTYARNTNFVLKYLTENQKIPKNKFKLIINNISNVSLEKDIMNKIFKEYEVLGYIPYNKAREKYINKQKPFILSMDAKKDLDSYVEVIENLGYIPKRTLLDRLMKKDQLVKEIIENDADELDDSISEVTNEKDVENVRNT